MTKNNDYNAIMAPKHSILQLYNNSNNKALAHMAVWDMGTNNSQVAMQGHVDHDSKCPKVKTSRICQGVLLLPTKHIIHLNILEPFRSFFFLFCILKYPIFLDR